MRNKQMNRKTELEYLALKERDRNEKRLKKIEDEKNQRELEN